MHESEDTAGGQGAAWRFGQRHPRTVVALLSVVFLACAVTAVIAAAAGWDDTSAPALYAAVGALTGIALAFLGWWVWLREHEVSRGWAVPLWVLPFAAIGTAVSPDAFPGWASMLAYGFLVTYLLGSVVLFVAGVRAREGMDEDTANERAARAHDWVHGR